MRHLDGRTSQLQVAATIVGTVLPLLVWVLVKYGLHVSDRYLPSPVAVATAFRDIDPSIWVHAGATLKGLLLGGLLGTAFGVIGGIAVYYSPAMHALLNPVVQSLRSVPAVATVPFFLLWFGFEDLGKLLLVVLSIGLNVLVAAYQILDEMPDKYRVALMSFGHTSRSYPITVSLRLVIERILPTLRTSLSIAFGAVLVSELLGSQEGLGYLINTSSSTYAIHTIFLATIFIGLINVFLDRFLVFAWRWIAYWNRDLQRSSQ